MWKQQKKARLFYSLAFLLYLCNTHKLKEFKMLFPLLVREDEERFFSVGSNTLVALP